MTFIADDDVIVIFSRREMLVDEVDLVNRQRQLRHVPKLTRPENTRSWW